MDSKASANQGAAPPAGLHRGAWLKRPAGRTGFASSPEREPSLDLVDAGHSVPPGVIVAPVLSGGMVIRTARWMAPASPDGGSVASCPPAASSGEPGSRGEPGTVVICTGRTEFIEKYLSVVEGLGRRGFAVVVFDWRGQGLSQRPLGNPDKGHVDRFTDYKGDLLAVAGQVLEPFCPRPWYGLAHSMGGCIALAAAADHPDLFRRLVLSAPMVDFADVSFRPVARAFARICRHGGLAGVFAPGDETRFGIIGSFAGNPLTSDEARFGVVWDYLRADPRLRLGAPTLGWVHAAFAAMARLHADDFPERMQTPVLAVVPGTDRLVDSRATERLVARLRASRAVTVPGCRHEIMMERDVYRDQFWAAFDAFVPGKTSGP